MSTVRAGEFPEHALLARYRVEGTFTDCWVVDLPIRVSHAEYVEAFYTSALFGIERRLLGWFARRPSTDAQAGSLARGAADAFAAWRVEARAADQLLLVDLTRRTRSWLMTEPIDAGGLAGTRLYFGSAVVPRIDRATGRASMGPVFGALTGFHAVYSRALLRAARARLMRAGRAAIGPGGATGGAAPTAPVAASRTASSSGADVAPRQDRRPGRPAPDHRPARRAREAGPPRTVPDPVDPVDAEPRRAAAAFRERPSREAIAALPPFEQLPLERITVVDTPAKVDAALRAIRAAGAVGFDTESKPTFTRDAVRDGPHLIQLATHDQAFVVPIDARTPIDFLRTVLESDAIAKVGFGLDSDRGLLRGKLGIDPRATVELSQVLRSLGHKHALGAKAAVAVVLGRKLHKSKSVTTSNWAAPKLSPSQLLYAANDAYAALKVYEAMGSPRPEPTRAPPSA
jgi:hypothetical protein